MTHNHKPPTKVQLRDAESLCDELYGSPHVTDDMIAAYSVMARRGALTLVGKWLADSLFAGYLQDRHDDINIILTDAEEGRPVTIKTNKVDILMHSLILMRLYKSLEGTKAA